MFKHEFGSVEYYRDYFSDVIADVGSHDDVDTNRQTISNVLAGFKQAVAEWMSYHNTCAESYRELMDEFLKSE